jgi:hypothetical protein
MPPSSSKAAGGDVDAVAVGAGHTGLVAAAVLADSAGIPGHGGFAWPSRGRLSRQERTPRSTEAIERCWSHGGGGRPQRSPNRVCDYQPARSQHGPAAGNRHPRTGDVTAFVGGQ